MALARLGLHPRDFYQLTPIELHYALKDWDGYYFTPMKRTCEVLRSVGITVHNSAFGRARKDMITNNQHYMRFSWEKSTKYQTVDEMKQFILGLSYMKGVKVTQKGKKVE